MARNLTEKQQTFLNVLMDAAGGDVLTAKRMAGYADSYSTTEVVNSMKEEILDATQSYMARNAPKAAMAIVGGLYDPTELGLKDKVAAAKELLDRTGLVKTEKLQPGREQPREAAPDGFDPDLQSQQSACSK